MPRRSLRDIFGESDDSRGRGRGRDRDRSRRRERRVSESRESEFDLETGRFRDPETGRFEPGGSPPDYDERANRFRDENGRFKDRSADLFDEPEEVRRDALFPRG